MMPNDRSNAQKLKDLIFDLKRTKAQEKALREEFEGILTAVEALTSASDSSVVFQNLITAMKSVLHFEKAFILLQYGNHYDLCYSTESETIGRRIDESVLMTTFDRDAPHIYYDTYDLPNPFSLYPIVEPGDKAALSIPLIGKDFFAFFICVHSDKGFFGDGHMALSKRFIPVATQAIELLENSNRLKKEIIEKQKAEKKLKKAQKQLVQNAYREGFAENAISVLHNIGNYITPIKTNMSSLVDAADMEKAAYFYSKLYDKMMSKAKDLGVQAELREELGAMDTMNKALDQQAIRFRTNTEFCFGQLEKVSNTITTQQQYANLKDQTKSVVNLKSITEDILTMLAPELVKSGIQIETDIHDCLIHTEINGMHHVVLNFLTNAMEAIHERIQNSKESENHLIQVTIKSNSGRVNLSILDTGVGFTQAIHEDMFKFGFTTKDSGSGFGLHSCFNFLRSNGGDVKITSDGVGKGAKVEVTMPLYTEQN